MPVHFLAVWAGAAAVAIAVPAFMLSYAAGGGGDEVMRNTGSMILKDAAWALLGGASCASGYLLTLTRPQPRQNYGALAVIFIGCPAMAVLCALAAAVCSWMGVSAAMACVPICVISAVGSFAFLGGFRSSRRD
eukprot:TRINITY_DN85273_c0_g1_i1.p1 TRINITY_DN85273_c0_g1~~TRINITY_DN85273_c0_g1_i1.p1  ORF type:complete len:134 (+),score=12.04 TRINITY_DN85273_c0_g1_i1:26-427(+)